MEQNVCRLTPCALLSIQSWIIYDYFRQRCAQVVTNPPIDSLREVHVMSLITYVGREMNIFCEVEIQASRLAIKSPRVLCTEFTHLTLQESDHYRSNKLEIIFDAAKVSLHNTILNLCIQVEEMVYQGTVILVLSDRTIAPGWYPGASHDGSRRYLYSFSRKNLRCDAYVIIETASARYPYHFSVLLGFSTTAIYPFLAYESLASMVDNKIIYNYYRTVILNFRHGINNKLYKIMSKMGIVTVSSYQ
ncbi:glutamate synthase central domain-containing protein [Candidatus Steffania adelgidicola]|uniref:glutamate synthase central domain-containing protein n=1 Tax=Candidatus Steffania adelgidicola TaxID=1076626 RepID=UPI001D015D5E